MTAIVIARQLVALAAQDVGGEERSCSGGGQDRGREGGRGEQHDLDPATGTPRLRAALGEPPTPVIQLPNLRPAEDVGADGGDAGSTRGPRRTG